MDADVDQTCTPGPPTPDEPACKEEAREWFEFSDFYRTEIARLIVFVMTLGADSDSACDIAQESMIAVWRMWDEIITSPKAYSRVVASRAWVRVLRKPEVAALTEEHDHQDQTAIEPLQFLISKDEYIAVLKGLQQLPFRQRQVMAYTYDWFEPEDIAEILQIKPEAVRSSLYKARKTLRGTLDEKAR